MDAHPKGMLWARILHAPYGRARLEEIDIEAARRVPGFKAITGDQQAGKVYSFAGQPVCAIAATSEEAADDIIRALGAQWEAQPASTTLEKTLRDVSNGIAQNNVLGDERKNEKGDVAAALTSGPARVEGRYRVPTQHQFALSRTATPSRRMSG
jgi:xanthine dehydrogenase molybdopterin-binding subunit B